MNASPDDPRPMHDDDATLRDHELASAYLDGEADLDERARVDSSAELQALVVSFQQVRDIVGAAPAVAAVDRDAAVAAALAEFDRLATLPAAPSNVVPLARRQRWSRVLGAAAAVILLGVVGVAAVNGLKSSDDSASSGTSGNDQFTVAGDAQKTTEDSSGRPVVTIGSINAPAVAVPQFSDPSQLRAMPSPEMVSASTVAGSTADSLAPTDGGVAADTTASAATPLFSFECPLTEHQIVLGEIVWMDTPAVAVRDTVTGVTQALDHQCNVLVSVEP